ncbi:MAG: tetratricopeptide repeat protein [Deltaproteobacteria bacterium]
MNIKFILFIACIMMFYACQTAQIKGIGTVDELSKAREQENKRIRESEEYKIREWEEYMGLLRDQDLSHNTILRLTEEYLQAKDIVYKKDMEEYDRRTALYQKGQLKELPKEPVQDYSTLISRFKPIAKNYRYGKGADAILYITAFALYEHGKRDEAAKIFEEMLKTYPYSDYFLEVSFRLGEFYFETGQMGEALEAYKKAINFRDSLLYEKALYKIGWIYYKIDDFEKSAQSFVSVLDSKWSQDGKQDGLTEEAVTSTVMALSHFKGAKQSIDFLTSQGTKKMYLPAVMVQLGDKLTEETRFDDTLLVYKTLEEWFPENSELPVIYDKIANLYDKMSKENDAIATDWLAIHKFNPGTAWYKKNYYKSNYFKAVDALLSKKMISISKKYHVRGKKEAKPEYLEKAIDGYWVFLSSYPAMPEAKNINLLLAEALFDAGKYAEAAEEYKKAANLYPAGAERGDIAFSALLTYEVIFYQSEKGDKEIIKPAELLVAGYESDLIKNGKFENSINKIADMYTQIGDYDKARSSIKLLAKVKDPTLVSLKTAELYLKENNLAAAEDLYARLNEKQSTPATKDALANIRYSIAEEHVKEERFKDAVTKFNQVFSTFPGSKVGEAALVKLGYLYLQKKEIDSVEDIAIRFVKAYPESGKTLPLMVEAGRGIEREEPVRAAGLYEKASTLTRDHVTSTKLALAAALLYEANKDYQKAEPLYKKYLERESIPLNDEADVRLRLGTVQFRTGKKKEGLESLNMVLALEGKVNETIIGKARLLMLEVKESVYLGTKLTQSFEETFQKKTSLLDGLLKDYSQVIKYKVLELQPEVYFKMGTALENFKETMIQSERPSGMSKEELEEYSFLLEERAYPYEEQSVKAFEKGLLAGVRNRINNDWVDKCFKKLASIRPAVYKRDTGEKGPEPLFLRIEPVRLEKGL